MLSCLTLRVARVSNLLQVKSNEVLPLFLTQTGIFKSSCRIDVRWFPFDVQRCELKFGSWTYNGWLLDLRKVDAEVSEYIVNGEWDLVGEVERSSTDKQPPPKKLLLCNWMPEMTEVSASIMWCCVFQRFLGFCPKQCTNAARSRTQMSPSPW